MTFVPWRAIDKYHNYRNMRPDIRELEAQHDFGSGIVLIRGTDLDYQSAVIYGPLDNWDSGPIYAWDRDSGLRREVLNVFPDRPVWLLDGPDATRGPFRITAGPMTLRDRYADRPPSRSRIDVPASKYTSMAA